MSHQSTPMQWRSTDWRPKNRPITWRKDYASCATKLDTEQTTMDLDRPLDQEKYWHHMLHQWTTQLSPKPEEHMPISRQSMEDCQMKKRRSWLTPWKTRVFKEAACLDVSIRSHMYSSQTCTTSQCQSELFHRSTGSNRRRKKHRQTIWNECPNRLRGRRNFHW